MQTHLEERLCILVGEPAGEQLQLPTIQGSLDGPSHVLKAHGRGPLQHQALLRPRPPLDGPGDYTTCISSLCDRGSWFLCGSRVLTEAAYLQHGEAGRPSSPGGNGGWDLPPVTFVKCVGTLWATGDTTPTQASFIGDGRRDAGSGN